MHESSDDIMEVSGGRLAHRNGAEAREDLACLLQRAGFQVASRVNIGSSIYERPLIVDLVVRDAPGWPGGIIVEVISQSTRGSADHKFPYTVTNIRERYPHPTIVAVAGSGFSAGALQWLRSQVDGRHLVAVTTPEHILGVLRGPAPRAG